MISSLFSYPVAANTTPAAIPIKDKVDQRNYGVIAIPQHCLQKIFKQSGPLATTAEFQVDYWNLVFRHTFADNSILDIAVPLVFFNYPQEVSGAHIDFEMKDVSAISDKLLPVANAQAAAVLATSFPSTLSTLFNLDFEPHLVPLNTIHRHPGGSAHQSFSSTDLSKNINDHGVVYPWKTAEPNTSNFAGIMAIDSGVCNLAHMEYRLVEGTIGTDIEYRQGNCVAYSYTQTTKSNAQSFMSNEPDIIIHEKGKGKIQDNIAAALRQLYLDLYSIFTPSTDFIFEENITARASVYKWPGTNVTTKTKTKSSKATIERYSEAELLVMDINNLRTVLKNVAFAVAEDIYTAQELIGYTREQLIEELLLYYNYSDAASSKAADEDTDFEFHTISTLDTMLLYDLRKYLNHLAKYVSNESYPLEDTISFTKADVISEIMTYYRDYHDKLAEEKAAQTPAPASAPATQPYTPAYRQSKHKKQSLKRMTYDPLKGWYTRKDI